MNHRRVSQSTAVAMAPQATGGEVARLPLPRLKVSDDHCFLATADGQPFF